MHILTKRKLFPTISISNDVQTLQNDACTKLQAGVRYKTEARIDEAVRFVDMCICLLAHNQRASLMIFKSTVKEVRGMCKINHQEKSK